MTILRSAVATVRWKIQLLIGVAGVLTAAAGCDENRCESTQRALLEDTQPFSLCAGDSIAFRPSELIFRSRVADIGAGGLGGQGGTFESTETVTLVASGTGGWRRDRARIDLFLSEKSCGTSKEAGGAFPVRLGQGKGCTQTTDDLLTCFTDESGVAAFSVTRRPGMSGVVHVCADAGVVVPNGLSVTVSSERLAEAGVDLDGPSETLAEAWACQQTGTKCDPVFRTLRQELVFKDADGEQFSVPTGTIADVTVSAGEGVVGLGAPGVPCLDPASQFLPTTRTLDLGDSGGVVTLCVLNDGKVKNIELGVMLEDTSESVTRNLVVYPETVFVGSDGSFQTCSGETFPITGARSVADSIATRAQCSGAGGMGGGGGLP